MFKWRYQTWMITFSLCGKLGFAQIMALSLYM